MIKTKIMKINLKTPSKDRIKLAAGIIRNGKLVAFPTETVYGLGANALDAQAVRGIFKAKGRPCDNPIIVHIASEKQLSEVATETPIVAKKLIKKFWPGPLTLVLKKRKHVPYEVTGGLDTVAVRMPANKIALALIKGAGVPIAAPSANLSGKPSPTDAKHVFDDMNGRIDLIIDGGRTLIGVESTVLDLTTNPPRLLRPGKISLEELEQVIGPILTHIGEVEKARSPGMRYRHYAPKAKIIICKDIDNLKKKIKEFKKKKKKIAILKLDKNPEKIAKNLFGILREFDKKHIDVILCESLNKIKKKGIGLAVIDRLKRAASIT